MQFTAIHIALNRNASEIYASPALGRNEESKKFRFKFPLSLPFHNTLEEQRISAGYFMGYNIRRNRRDLHSELFRAPMAKSTGFSVRELLNHNSGECKLRRTEL